VSQVSERVEFSLVIVPADAVDVSTRRFHWKLVSSDGHERPSAETFSTRREAMREGEIQLERARQRGRIGI
jgi:hypothetical protein